MIIGGLQKVSLIDYPGHVSCVVFFAGCNFRCVYCQNPELVLPELIRPALSEEEFFAFLRKRVGKLDGVVLCGGEPTFQKGIVEFAERVKSMGFKVKLDTNGYFPDVLERMIEKGLVDYVAMDVKAPLEKYSEIVKVPVDISRIVRSIDIVMNSDIDYEFRTTVYPALTLEDFKRIGELIRGAEFFTLEQFSNRKVLSEEAKRMSPYPVSFLFEIKKLMENYVKVCRVVNI